MKTLGFIVGTYSKVNMEVCVEECYTSESPLARPFRQVESNNAMANQPTVDHSWTGAFF